MDTGFAIVIDIGKTLAKVSVWSRDGRMLDRQVRPNNRNQDGTTRLLDTAATQRWLIDKLAGYAHHPIEYIVPVAHGAAIAGIRDGELAFAPPDYESELTEGERQDYASQRDPFGDTGSPALPCGLNFGAQMHALEARDPDIFKGVTLMTYAQYWAWLLTGNAVSEVTSLGCHSDIWSPAKGDFSPMAKRRGWADLFAPIARAGDVVGTLKPEVAERTGLSPDVKVLAGIHDSNAALLAARGFAEIEDEEATVLSTGTWFISMRLAKEAVDLRSLPEGRDCLVNVDAYGRPVPSARFMGGREIETLIELDTRQVDIKPDQPKLLAAVREVVDKSAMVLPTLTPETGPYPNREGGWVNAPDDWYARRSAACIYAAMVANTSLDLIGAKGRLLVEGRFAEAEVFVRALASLRPDMAIYVANAHNDVGLGALRLIDPSLAAAGTLNRAAPLDIDISDYYRSWCDRTEAAA